ncbi:hypothetical protein SAMN05428966_10271 [Massilia sp. PDC64]|nr:hypothetical protein [Massilia sp. PDC64]SDC66662.1 hypothetical protein SAMN05428966_10271 [Massilia sp. PDC64]
MQFRKKPVVIEAVQFTQAVRDAFIFDDQLLPAGVTAGRLHCHPGRREVYSADFYIETLEGRMEVSLDDWIITGVKGEHYPCKPDIFAATYEPAESQQPASGAAYAGYITMQPHQQRVVDEKAELDDKRSKLLNFTGTTVFTGLDAEERRRLLNQLDAMDVYSDILGERIAAFAPAHHPV